MNKRDFAAIALILLISAAGFLFLLLPRSGGGTAVIKSSGEVVGEYALSQNRKISLPDNIIVIENGSVYMKSAGCPDKYCVKQGRISRSGESLVCLPNRVTVEIISGSPEIDAVSN